MALCGLKWFASCRLVCVDWWIGVGVGAEACAVYAVYAGVYAGGYAGVYAVVGLCEGLCGFVRAYAVDAACN